MLVNLFNDINVTSYFGFNNYYIQIFYFIFNLNVYFIVNIILILFNYQLLKVKYLVFI